MGASRDPSVRVGSTDQFGNSVPGGIYLYQIEIKLLLQAEMEEYFCVVFSVRWLSFPVYQPHTLPPPVHLFRTLSVAIGRNQPLKKEKLEWTSDIPLTDGQLRSKRDEFWETAPAFDGRKEIWDALRAACETDDHGLAQAILDGANITLPTGQQLLVWLICSRKYTT